MELKRRDGTTVLPKFCDEFPCCQVPQLDQPIIGPAHHPVAVWAEAQAVDGICVALVRLNAAFPLYVPDLQPVHKRKGIIERDPAQVNVCVIVCTNMSVCVAVCVCICLCVWLTPLPLSPHCCLLLSPSSPHTQTRNAHSRMRTLRFVSKDPEATNSPKG